MKKILLWVILMLLPIFLTATPMNVVGEVFTSTSCGYCPSARAGIRDLAANFDNFIPLIWQSTGGYVGMPSPNYSTRGTMYGVNGIPHARFGGYLLVAGGIPSGSMYSNYLPRYNAVDALESPLSIDIVMDYSSESTLDIQADVEVTGSISTTNNRVIFLLTNKYDNEYTCAVVAYYEEDFDLTTVGQTGTYTTSFSYNPDWDLTELKAIAIVQTLSSNYKIHQAATCGVSGIFSIFSSNIQSGPPQLGVQFYNESYPDTGITSFEWDFDGDGTWDSTEENPYHLYDTVGSYNVSLHVSDGVETATTTVEDYITVTNPSDISGELAGTWSPTYGTYTVTGDITIPSGAVLSIEPNTNVVVNNGSIVKIKGKIEAVGSEDNFINFSTDDTWEGILIQDSQEENIIDCCYFTGATSSAVDIDNSVIDILNNVFYENSNTSQKGPAINVVDAIDVLIEGNIIANNYSTVLTGGIALDNSPIVLSHNIIVNNEANFAGGVSLKNSSDASFVNNTIANNKANYACIYMQSSYPDFLNTIIIHDGLIFTTFSGNPTVNYSCISGGYTGTGNISDDPQFVNPTAGDGPDYNGLEADWGLQETSPCIDAGNPASPYDPDSTIADMGALYYDHDISVDDPEINSNHKGYSFPNPFKQSTTISFSIQRQSKVELDIYNLKGQKVKTLVSDELPSDTYEYVWDGTDESKNKVTSGVYFYRLKTDEHCSVDKMLMIK